ncbi:MAG: PqqD family peptide modification chaperone [Bacteroidetes bacterium]|nr:PqqD family peptide modification chaperone [Bacteroidota bacterium]
MDLNKKISRSDNYVFNEVDGELVMMNIETGSYASLNETGKSIWLQLETAKTLDSVIEGLIAEYEIDRATCEQEVFPFVEKMVKDEILILA